MAFKIKKPIWHGTDSHKEEIEKQVKKGAPQMTFTPGAKGYDFGGGENTLLEKDYKSKYPNLYGDPFATDESTDDEYCIPQENVVTFTIPQTFDMFYRFGGGICVTRMVSAMKAAGIISGKD